MNTIINSMVSRLSTLPVDASGDRAKAKRKLEALSPAQATRIEQYLSSNRDFVLQTFGDNQKVAFRVVDFMQFCMSGDTLGLSSTSAFTACALAGMLLKVTDKNSLYSLAGGGERFNIEATFTDPMMVAKLKRVLARVGSGSAATAKSHTCGERGMLPLLGLAKPTKGVPEFLPGATQRAIVRDFVKTLATLSDYSVDQLMSKTRKEK